MRVRVSASLCARVSLLTHGGLIVGGPSATVVLFQQRSQHLGAQLRLPLQRHIGRDHLIVRVQVVTRAGERGRERERGLLL